jgi:hypothetical protein
VTANDLCAGVTTVIFSVDSHQDVASPGTCAAAGGAVVLNGWVVTAAGPAHGSRAMAAALLSDDLTGFAPAQPRQRPGLRGKYRPLRLSGPDNYAISTW